MCFTAKRMMWFVKENGQSWDGDYFRGTILIDNVMLFLKNPENVMCPYQTTFLHDRAPRMSALATQHLLRANNIEFVGKSEWPGYSLDLNACENLGAILKDRVESRLALTNGLIWGS